MVCAQTLKFQCVLPKDMDGFDVPVRQMYSLYDPTSLALRPWERCTHLWPETISQAGDRATGTPPARPLDLQRSVYQLIAEGWLMECQSRLSWSFLGAGPS
jgi:hypothetical protein